MRRSARLPSPAVEPSGAEVSVEPRGPHAPAEDATPDLRVSRRGFLALLAHPLVFDLESDR